MTRNFSVLSAYSGVSYEKALLDVHGRELTIASAFGVSLTKINLLRQLAKQNRMVTFIVGTQGGFTSPDFIDAGRQLANDLGNFEFIVDFRVDGSIHHKWALASPETVMVGSSNFTRKGLEGACDLMALVSDGTLYTRIASELTQLRSINGVFSADDPAFIAAEKTYRKLAEKLSDIELKKVAAKSKSNPYKAAQSTPCLADWLDSDCAGSLRIFGYARDLDAEEQQAAAMVQEKAGEHGVELEDVAAYCPTRSFTGPFLDVDGIHPKRPRIYPAEALFHAKADGRTIVLARRLPQKSLGFEMTPDEMRCIAAIALKKSEGRLSVADMREALKGLAVKQ